ncbi:MAG: hypothetical protein JXD22_16015 [Sedimentisphaerales bacterium]|nr:hypothetical protein [Sedimentisphaerales bacterium]
MMEVRGRCSLLGQVRVVESDISAWRLLAKYHYRTERPGAIDRIFAMEFADGGGGQERWRRLGVEAKQVVGVIVYAMPLAGVSLRNAATGNRYKELGSRSAALQLLNREMRWISRVVIHPQFRGIGLAQRLVAETLGRVGTEMVEALAAMGRVNPFFEKAGMTRYEGPRSAPAERLIGAFEELGFDKGVICGPEKLRERIGGLGERERRFIEAEMLRFAQGFVTMRRRGQAMAVEELLEVVSSHVYLNPVYYLWRRPRFGFFR